MVRLALWCALMSFPPAEDARAPSPADVFEQRIMPIFRSPQPASCVQCHLSSVDLKDYILPSHEQTFVSLRDQGLIDLAEPEKSKILTLIRMGEEDLDRGARLIHESQRKAEYDAFAAWIKACCADPRLSQLPRLAASELARPNRPDAVIRHARKSRVVDSFIRNVWSQRMRCFPCHTPHELDENNPKHRQAIEKHKEFLAKQGKQFADRMHIFRESPEATVDYLIERSRNTPPNELPLINLEDPTKSLLVLKPTAKIPAKNEQGELGSPSYTEPVSHLGGLKMHVDDQSFKSFVAWIQDYARVVGNEYASVDDLPADNWFASKHVIIMREVPTEWSPGTRVQFFVHPWNERDDAWHRAPVAFTQGSVTPVRNVAGVLFVFGPNENPSLAIEGMQLNPENARLKPGKYLVKAYVDNNRRLAENPTVLLGDEDLFGEVEIDAKWGEGFPQAERIPGGRVVKR